MTIRARLPEPIVFGAWVMPHREYAVVRVRSQDGVAGYAYTLTREGAVAEQVRKSLAPAYVGSSVSDCERTWTAAWRSSLGAHASGVGLRALSLVDLAAWDNEARFRGLSVTRLLGGTPAWMPATAIIGYPPSRMGPTETAAEAAVHHAEGWRRFKLPIAATPELSAARLRAVRAAVPDDWIGLDGAWLWDDAEDAANFVNSLEDVRLGWFEDVFPPGDIASLRRLRAATNTRIAMGDEQADAYFPEALIDAGQIDVVRIDATCMGGITRLRRILDQTRRARLPVAPHMFGPIHAQVLAGLGVVDAAIEWSFPGTGVDPYTDSLLRPTIHDGLMEPLPESPGFGAIVNRDWIESQSYDDPDGVLEGLTE